MKPLRQIVKKARAGGPMATKKKTQYLCQECGHTEPKWLGKCPSCGAWNTFTEFSPPPVPKGKGTSAPPGQGQILSEIPLEKKERTSTGMKELDQVLGGGLMRGSCILIGGEPGIGKSTLLMQLAGNYEGRILYVSGEESEGQIKNRAVRLGISEKNITLLCSSYLEDIQGLLDREAFDLVMVDSIQTIYSPEGGSTPGTVAQLKTCAFELIQQCKRKDISLFFVAHVTKGGSIAGPKALEHMVDTVLYFESSGTDLRMIRSTKNRFGSVDELGIFAMEEKGLEEVGYPEALFLTDRSEGLPPGIAVAAVYEGSRVFLVEIQALTVSAKGGLGRVYSDKIDHARVNRIAAVLEKHLGLRFSDQDIYANVAGGIKLLETGIDLALAAALYSARTGIPLPQNTVLAGEISLAGELRPISHIERRKKAAEILGYRNFLGPVGHKKGNQDLKKTFQRLFSKETGKVGGS